MLDEGREVVVKLESVMELPDHLAKVPPQVSLAYGSPVQHQFLAFVCSEVCGDESKTTQQSF